MVFVSTRMGLLLVGSHLTLLVIGSHQESKQSQKKTQHTSFSLDQKDILLTYIHPFYHSITDINSNKKDHHELRLWKPSRLFIAKERGIWCKMVEDADLPNSQNLKS